MTIAATADPFAIEVRDVRKTYRTGLVRKKSFTALRNVSLDVPRGGIYGLLGPNGAGKTTLIKVLLGIVRFQQGSARILGLPAGSMPARRRIGYLPENNRIPRHHTAHTALEYFGGLSGLTPKDVRARRGPLLERVGLGNWGDKPVRQFSKGMQQRLGLAQAMLHDPELLILDEPTDGVDPVGRAELRDVLLGLRAEGKTIFLNSHHLQEMELVCDRVAIMDHGRVLRTGRIAELTSEPALRVVLRGTSQAALAALETPADAEHTMIVDETADHTTLRMPQLPPERWDALVDRWRAAGLGLIEIVRERRTLEESFLAELELSRNGSAADPRIGGQ